METLRLITIPISHYCEKARWALDRLGLPYVEEPHLQLFHYVAVRRVGPGDSVPVLVNADGVWADSTDILKWSDTRAPSLLKLYPADAEQRRLVEELETVLDEGLGVAGRLWMYTYMLDDISLIVGYSRKHGVPWYETRLLPLVYPLVKARLRGLLNLRPDSRKYAKRIVDRTFQEIAARLSDGRPFLLGSRFSAADLTFAALAASVLIPEDYGVSLPSLAELPPGMADQVRVWRQHPAGIYALKMFRDHRRPSK